MRFFPNATGSLLTVQGTPPAGSPLLGGLAFNALNEVYVTTTLGANDAYISGFRVSALGQLVVGDGVVAARPYVYNGGFPFDKRNGALIRQLGQTPLATDPYVQGIRIGELGGVFAVGGPANLTLPVVTGTPTVGQILTCSPGTWQGTPTITYLWFVDGVSTGNTTNSYTVTAGNVALGSFIYCQVTATDVTGVTSVNSNTVTTAILPVNTVAPVISGTALVGATLTSTAGTWTGSPTPVLTYQWKANGVAIPGATANTYVIAAQGTSYTCTVTGTNNAGSVAATSNAIVSQTAPVNIDAPTVTGEGTPGQTLTCGNGTWTGTPPITYAKQWRADSVNISGQTGNTYVVQAGDVGKIITCAVTATNTVSAVTAISNGVFVTAAAGSPPVNTVAPVISGTGTVGNILSLTSQGAWTGTPPISYTYQWQRDGANTGNTGNSYVVQAGDAGKTITCRVTGTNVDGVSNASSNGILVTAVVFSPASLFAAGEQGGWYDPSDFSTMFQDSAGTTPVTAVGQSVGLILDKSKGLALGSELLVNGDFSSGSTGWSAGSEFVISGGQAVFTGAAAYSVLSQQPNGPTFILPGSAIEFTFEIKEISGGTTCRVLLGSTPIHFYTTVGVKKCVCFSPTQNYSIGIDGGGGGVGTSLTVDNFSAKFIAGNHAFQVTAAARPVLANNAQTKPFRDFDAVDDNMGTIFPSSLGSTCTVGRSSPTTGAVILTNQTIGTTYTANADDCALIITNDALTGQETTDLTAWLNGKAGV